jgi:hypothetical protein
MLTAQAGVETLPVPPVLQRRHGVSILLLVSVRASMFVSIAGLGQLPAGAGACSCFNGTWDTFILLATHRYSNFELHNLLAGLGQPASCSWSCYSMGHS